MESESKTSDEILEELFVALNVPLSPKTKKGVATPPEKPDNSGDSEGSDNKEADSKSSESEEDTKGQEEKMAKNHKHKTSKKKKEKKKKKKKHKKKDDDSRHKSKKKHKRDSVIQLEENTKEILTEVDVSKASEDAGKLSPVVQEQSEKFSGINHLEMEKIDMLKSKSPRSEEESSKSLISLTTKLKSDTGSDSGSKEESLKKHRKKLHSPQRSHSSSKSARSRSRSTSRIRQHRHSRSRSRSRHLRHSRSRSRSRSKHITRQSRSSSRTKSSSVHKSKTKSPHRFEKLKHKRKSRSRSKSLSPKRSKKQRVSRFHSRSISPKKSKRRSSRSYSKSLSPKISRKKRYSRSRSLSPSKLTSKQRSRSRSGSHKGSSHQRENSSLINMVPENSLCNLETSKDQKNINIDLSMIPTPAITQLGCPSTLPVSLESIPLPIPPVSSEVSDPSSIPLPQPVISSKPQKSGKGSVEAIGTGIDVGAIPVPVAAVEVPVKEQEPTKSADTGSEKGKAKMIIIKSLKDSLIYMQAQEEAERRAKVKQDDEEKPIKEEKLDENILKEKDKVYDEKEDDDDEEKDIKEEQEMVQIKENIDKVEEDQKIENLELDTDKGNGDDLNGMEEGEIPSEDEVVEEEVKTSSHKKKSKKDKDKNKEKKKNKKDKSKEKKRRSREKSKSKERTKRSRSKSKERSRHKKSSRSWHRSHDVDRRYKRYSRSRSRSRNRLSRFRHRSYSRSRSRSRSRSGRKRDCVSDLRDKVTRKRLLEIARRNAVYLMQNGCLPPSVEQEQLVKIKTGGKSVEELTDFCKQLVATGNYSDVELSDPSLSSEEDNDNPDKPFSYTRHPFSVRDSKPILMNIRNAPMLPTKTNAERLADHAKLREQFPVSSGSQHRTKGEVKIPEDKVRTADSGWVPVSPKEKKPKEEDSVFSKEEPPAVDISQIVSSRLSAMRKLQDNPHDMEALKTLHNVQKEMQSWALSKQEPGQFTGSTGVKILSQEELCAGQQAWVRKEQFKEAAPVRPHFGLKMLQKMGWTPGEGLGKNKDGDIEPLLLDVKMDKKGFHAQEELTPKKPPIPMAKDLSARKCNKPHSGAHSGIGKHPVSALVELCAKRKWQLPEFDMVFDYGPDHKKNFLMKVRVNGQEYKPAVAGLTKKLAKANAAAACLQSLGLFPNDPFVPLTTESA